LSPGSSTRTPKPINNENSNRIKNTNVAILAIIAAILIAVLSSGVILYKLFGPKNGVNNRAGPANGTENVITPPAMTVKIQPSVDTNPKLEIEGGELPSLDTGISLRLKLDPGRQSFQAPSEE
jgi:hypothetical protein